MHEYLKKGGINFTISNVEIHNEDNNIFIITCNGYKNLYLDINSSKIYYNFPISETQTLMYSLLKSYILEKILEYNDFLETKTKLNKKLIKNMNKYVQ